MAIKQIGKNLIHFNIPNSEAVIECQRNGIKDRSVGQYYIGNNIKAIEDFFVDYDNSYFVDFACSILNIGRFFEKVHALKIDMLYKDRMKSSFEAFELIKSTIEKDYTYSFLRIDKPKLGLTKKYLKLDSNLTMVKLFKQLILGDLIDLMIEKNTKLIRIFLIPNPQVKNFDTHIEFANFFNKLDSHESN